MESIESTSPNVDATMAMIASNASTRLVMKARSGSLDNILEINFQLLMDDSMGVKFFN